jgi:hypothetical protein
MSKSGCPAALVESGWAAGDAFLLLVDFLLGAPFLAPFLVAMSLSSTSLVEAELLRKMCCVGAVRRGLHREDSVEITRHVEDHQWHKTHHLTSYRRTALRSDHKVLTAAATPRRITGRNGWHLSLGTVGSCWKDGSVEKSSKASYQGSAKPIL